MLHNAVLVTIHEYSMLPVCEIHVKFWVANP